MNREIIFAVFFIFIFSSFIPVGFADVVEPGMKTVDLYYKVSNIDSYPDYFRGGQASTAFRDVR